MTDEIEFYTREAAAALAGLAEQVANGAATDGWDSTLGRWWDTLETVTAEWAQWSA
jgi:hypothetical protein